MDIDRGWESLRDVFAGAGGWLKTTARLLLAASLCVGVPALDLFGITASFGAALGWQGRVLWVLITLSAFLIGSQEVYEKRKELEELEARGRSMPENTRKTIQQIVVEAGRANLLVYQVAVQDYLMESELDEAADAVLQLAYRVAPYDKIALAADRFITAIGVVRVHMGEAVDQETFDSYLISAKQAHTALRELCKETLGAHPKPISGGD